MGAAWRSRVSPGGGDSTTRTESTSDPRHVCRSPDSGSDRRRKCAGGGAWQQRRSAPEPNHLQPGAERGAGGRLASVSKQQESTSELADPLKHLCVAPQSEFAHSHYADTSTREKLAAEIRLPEDTIKVPGSSVGTVTDVCWLFCS